MRKHISKLFKKAIPHEQPLECHEYEEAWNKKEAELEESMKKSHWWLWAFHKLEPFIMWAGFIGFLAEPILRIWDLDIISRPLSGGALGLGFAVWLRGKGSEKMYFGITMMYKKLLDDILAMLQQAEKEVKNTPPRKVN